MNKHYYYPAIIRKSKDGGYCAEIPGMPGCSTQGETTEELMFMITDAIGLYLEENIANDTMPEPLAPETIKVENDEHSECSFLVVVDFQPEEYLRRIGERAVKKTLTIPSWLNELASRRGLNFSQILQEGLKQHLGLADTE